MFWDKLKGNRLGFFDLFNRHAAASKEGTLALLKLSESFPTSRSTRPGSRKSSTSATPSPT